MRVGWILRHTRTPFAGNLWSYGMARTHSDGKAAALAAS